MISYQGKISPLFRATGTPKSGPTHIKIGLEQLENLAWDKLTRELEFAELNHLVVPNTLHPHKNSRRVTWISNDGKTQKQIDYILVSRRFQSSTIPNKTRSFPGADVGSDHTLVMINVPVKLRRIPKKKSTRVKYNVYKLKEPDTMRAFQAVIGGRYAPLMQLNDVDKITEEFTKVYNETALEVLGKEKRVIKPLSNTSLVE